MITRRRIVTVAAVAAALIGVSVPAWAYFTASASSSISAAATTLSAPSSASAVAASTSSVTITVTATPASGPTPTAYRVDRTSTTSPGSGIGVCTIATSNGLGSCTDVGLQAGTAYSYAIYSQIGTQWVSSSSATASGATSASAGSYSKLIFVNCTVGGVARSCTNLTASAGTNITGHVEAVDQFGNIVTPSATITVELSSSDSKWLISPASVTISASTNPSSGWTVTNSGANSGHASTTITARDPSNSSITPASLSAALPS